jgi:sulfur relay (sulfurtransferase) DsrC/TusE family protein
MKNKVGTTLTENGALTFDKSGSKVLDFYSLGGALRSRTDADVLNIFLNAVDEDALLALKTLFYLRDVRGGQGERKVFRTCLKWLAEHGSIQFTDNMENIVKFGRWDDLFVAFDTVAEVDMLAFVKKQLGKDAKAEDNNLSLLAKWMPSANTSSATTRKLARRFIKYLKVSPAKYRKTLSRLRGKLNLVETAMSSGEWSDINFEHVPSKANLVYKKAFSRHEPERYTAFIKAVQSGEKKMNAGALYPYEIVRNIVGDRTQSKDAIDALWNSMPDFLKDNPHNGLVLPDVSGSMSMEYGTGVQPLWVSVSLAIYFAQRNKGFFKDHFLEFSSTSQLVKIRSTNIVDAWNEVSGSTAWCGSTNLQSAFDAILDAAVQAKVPAEDMPSVLYIISDMEFNEACTDNQSTNFQVIQQKYSHAGYKMPVICFWNVSARSNQSPVTRDQNGVIMVSGCSPSIFSQVISNTTVTPYEFMLETLNKERYASVIV